MNTIRLTAAQAVIQFLDQQYVERDGVENKFFAGCFGIFGHGNVAGIGQALHQYEALPFYQSRNEQAMVHAAAAFAKVKKRMSAFACTTSIGPGATNMITGAATATINRLPVLLLPGDFFSNRSAGSLLQQIEVSQSPEISANDCFKPVSKYWDRINRPEQLIHTLPEVMRVLTSPSDTGAVTLAMPHDVQTEAYDFPTALFEKRVWTIPRNRPDMNVLKKAVELIKNAKKPVIVSGGGVLYSHAEEVLNDFAAKTGIPVGETYAGKGAVRYDAPYALGGLGATGTVGAIEIANEADVVIGIGTRYSDFITGSRSLFKNPNVQFININVCEMDGFKMGGLPLRGDAKATLGELAELLADYEVATDYRAKVAQLNEEWEQEVQRIYNEANDTVPPIHQGAVLGILNDFMDEQDIMINAAGSMPGDLHKLWRTTNPYGFHVEYGFSCMGYEIAGGLGAKMAAPQREVYVLCGDGSYWMLNHEIITSIQEGYKIIIMLSDNDGYASIGSLSKSIGSERFGTKYRYREGETGQLSGTVLPVDIAKNVESLGALVFRATDKTSLIAALEQAKAADRTAMVYIKTDLERTIPGYNAWWEVPIAEVSTQAEVQQKRKEYESKKRNEQRIYL
ncbi:MAG: 3D-(3,5/4)-trihydroxycyclohexane-1,2-dione acylhydrolase (decyclizing) [Bacteroidota bacterium]